MPLGTAGGVHPVVRETTADHKLNCVCTLMASTSQTELRLHTDSLDIKVEIVRTTKQSVAGGTRFFDGITDFRVTSIIVITERERGSSALVWRQRSTPRNATLRQSTNRRNENPTERERNRHSQNMFCAKEAAACVTDFFLTASIHQLGNVAVHGNKSLAIGISEQ